MIGDYQTVARFVERFPSIGTIAGGINALVTQNGKGFNQKLAYVDFVIHNEDTLR